MKSIIKYEAFDGTEFASENACAAYEVQAHRAEEIAAQLPPRPTGINFSNGYGYIQHDPETLAKVRREACELALTHFDHDWFRQVVAGQSVDWSYPARLIDEIQNKPLRDLSYRLYSIDKENREWGQPYFAAHASNAKASENRRLN